MNRARIVKLEALGTIINDADLELHRSKNAAETAAIELESQGFSDHAKGYSKIAKKLDILINYSDVLTDLTLADLRAKRDELKGDPAA